MMNIARKRGFMWPSFEIYEGTAGFIDYGPLGAILKNNIMQKWRDQYITQEGFFEIDTPTVTPGEILKASGHVDHFTDPMTKCEACSEVYRADHIIEEQIDIVADGLENEKLTEIIKDENIVCPECGGRLSEVWNYNLMFETLIGAKGKKVGYMRPETAQGIFITFKRLLRFFRNKLPFGVVQLGKSYRNEISPRQGMIRLREFTQAESEIFIHPEEKTHPRFKNIVNETLTLDSQETQQEEKPPLRITAQEALDSGIVSSEFLVYQLYLARKFLTDIGIPEEVLRFRQHLPNEMAHYAIDCWDVEVKTDRYGWIEIIGIADRGDYDLKSHMEKSKEDLRVFLEYSEPRTITKIKAKPNMGRFGPIFKSDAPKIITYINNADLTELKNSLEADGEFVFELDGKEFALTPELLSFEEVEETVHGEKIVPHVIEPSFGIDRIFYSLLLHSFTEGVKNDGETKDYFKLVPSMAPIQVAVFPLVNKKEQNNIAEDITEELRSIGILTETNSSSTIGKRYAQYDEIGVPLAVTVDYDTLEDKTVTLRDRDSEKQIRIPITDLKELIPKLLNGTVSFNEL